MGAQENVQTAKEGYEAFAKGDAEGAMAAMRDDVEWKVEGDNAYSGGLRGKEEVGNFFGALAGKGFSTKPQQFLGDGDTVVVLTDNTIDGQSTSSADVLTYDSDGKLKTFETRGDPAVMNAAFPK